MKYSGYEAVRLLGRVEHNPVGHPYRVVILGRWEQKADLPRSRKL